MLWDLKDQLTPFHERLDPESTFYKHYMQKQVTSTLSNAREELQKETCEVLQKIAARLGPKADHCEDVDKQL